MVSSALVRARSQHWLALALLALVTMIVAAIAVTYGGQRAADAAAVPCGAATCIDNGTIMLAVNPEGHLNTDDASGSVAGPGDAGLHYIPTGNDSTSPGCLCEGWGAADAGSGVTGFANIDVDGGPINLDLVSFTTAGSSAVSVVTIDDTLQVTHDFHPSPDTANLYEVTVTIENLTAGALSDIRYRRVMDWDIEPTPFAEFVTIDPGTATDLLFTSDNGFETGNPLGGRTEIVPGPWVDSGPADHGALFDFGFGALAAGESVTFNIYYGAAGTEADAIAAVGAVDAEVFSFGQPSTVDGPTLGTPNTFIFAFAGVGGEPVFAPIAEDDTLTTTVDTPGSVDVLDNDSDPNGDPITVDSWTDGANGSVTCTSAGTCTYTPDAGFVGMDEFTYTITDGLGGFDTATVKVTVEDDSPPPVGSCDTGTYVVGVDDWTNSRLTASGHRQSDKAAITLPPGYYDITLVSFDPDHAPGVDPEQDEEQWFAEVFRVKRGKKDKRVYSSPEIDDLPEADTTLAQVVDTGVLLDHGDYKVRAKHGARRGSHSITALCVIFEPSTP